MSDPIPMLKGTLELLILKALSIESKHGYGLANWLEAGSGGQVVVEDSAIYQALRRLEGRRLVEAEWGLTENNRRARYYRLTSQGEKHLVQQSRVWVRYSEWVGTLLRAGDGIPG